MNGKNTPKVAILKSTYKNVSENIEKMFGLLEYTPVKESIFIKPNLVDSFSPKSGIVTSPKMVEAIVKYFRKNFPEKQIIIGDGCALHIDMENILNKSGYRYISDRYGIKIVSLDEVEREELTWEHGSLKLPEFIHTHEYINVPKLKTHMQTSVSISMKNQKGLLLKKNKQDFHRKFDLNDSIKLLTGIVKPDLNIIDGILSLEGNGPLGHGKPKKTNLIIGSTNI